MPNDQDAAELRRRAGALRRLAAHLDATPLPALLDQAGPDTWVSPRADELRADLGVDRRRLADAVDDLLAHARYLERQAEVAEVAEAAAVAALLPTAR
jgi:hypothetical protein